jgi:KipI family sensor histidine kinase inhibitor
VIVEFEPDVSAETTARVLGADAVIRTLPGVVETVPAFRSVLAVYDPRRVDFPGVAARAEAAARAAAPASRDAGRLVEVPVVYGGSSGPDLQAVADVCGLTPADVISLHSGSPYTVYMLGFSPGHPYLGSLPPSLRVPRRASPRPRVPAGSVGVADQFTNIYPRETAGGWHLLGRTALQLFDHQRDPAFLLAPGDRVRFVPVGEPPEPAREDGRAARPAVPASRAPRCPVFEVLEPGLMTTVQDLGRPGWRRYGVPVSGALDHGAHVAANLTVGNAAAAATLELSFPGPKLRATAAVEIAVAGADFTPWHNGASIDPGRPLWVRPGDVVEFAGPRGGQWAYLAVAGGFDVPEVFGSRSTYVRGGIGGFEGRPLRAGDVLGRGEGGPGPRRRQRAAPVAGRTGAIRVVLGPQTDAFSADAQTGWLAGAFVVTVQRDRSGMRLRGPVLHHRGGAEILSDGLLPGAVQVPAEGQPIIILADGPTTGGYSKIASVISADLDRVAQAGPGSALRFEAVTVAQAHAAWTEYVTDLTTPA